MSMSIGIATNQFDIQQLEEHRKRLSAAKESPAEPLRECVRSALRDYLRRLDGHEVNDLHAMVIGEVERPMIETLLEYTQGNQTQAARLLGVSRGTLRKKMGHYGIRG